MDGQYGSTSQRGPGPVALAWRQTPERPGRAVEGRDDLQRARSLTPPRKAKSQVPTELLRLFEGPQNEMSTLGIALSLAVPSCIFGVTSYAFSFALHAREPKMMYLVGLCGLVFWAVLTHQAFQSDGVLSRNRTSKMLSFTSGFAWVLAILLGQSNYWHNMQMYYAVADLNVYDSLDVTKTDGLRANDAGVFSFAENHHLDLSKASNFRVSSGMHDDTYCIAPISVGEQQLQSYDYWAVGKNCCDGARSFHCGEYFKDSSRVLSGIGRKPVGGIRVVGLEDLSYYELAVRQAATQFGIQVRHPVFFDFTMDPDNKVARYREHGFRCFVVWTATFVVLQSCIVVVQVLAFPKMKAFA